MLFKNTIIELAIINKVIFRIGRRQCFGPSYSIHLQCAASVPHILANLCDYGSPIIRGKILQGDILFSILCNWHKLFKSMMEILINEIAVAVRRRK